MTRRDDVLEAAVTVFAVGGLHALTHAAVDRRAAVPPGSTSNYFRTRARLVAAVADRVGELRLGEPTGGHDRGLALAWFELLIQAQREDWIREAIAPVRAQMADKVQAAMPSSLPWSAVELMALATGIEFAEAVTGTQIEARLVALLNGPDAEQSHSPCPPDDGSR